MLRIRLTGEEDIHVANNFVVNDDQKSEGKERCILKYNIQRDSPNVY